MKNKVVFITGAASGIGLAIAIAFANKGAAVVIGDLDKNKLDAVTDELRHQNLNVTGVKCDVTNENDLINVIAYTYRTFKRLDILINNAGLQYIAPIEEFPSDQFELLIKVMLTAPFFAIKHAFPIMKRQQFGRIINMSSINGLIGFPGKAAYNSAKHGVIGLTKVTALEGAAFGITANAVCPGYVDTPLVQNQLSAIAKNRNIPIESVLNEVIYPLIPQRRLLSVQEISNQVLYLAADEALGITGQAIVIDGGYLSQ